MFNRQRTLEVFGYDLDLSIRRRSNNEVNATAGKTKKDLTVIDNCPSCGVERQIQLRASKKNKPCYKCFHNSPEVIRAKQNQTKIKSEEHKQKMKDNHWSKKGMESAFKGKQHTEEVKQHLKSKTLNQFNNLSDEDYLKHRIKSSLQKGRTFESFNGFTSPENTRIRQSAEGKAWTLDVLSKANFTCDKCGLRGGKLHAHHKNAFASFPEQRFDIDNGVCLCESCHDTFHAKYGKGDNTEQQYLDFKKIV